MISDESLNRRNALQRLGLIAGGVPIALTMGASAARAGLSRKDVGYQLTPHGAQKCALCASFIASADAAPTGKCKLVDGPIPVDGWCQLFAKR